ncbi:MAG: 4-hydroxy-3-methylbut-2-enyl diphosphate reductase [Treponema sp.]|jgi:4-hydroxy-3-methylbut-2-enyl diphosphate reductase|nr:4-hydroxy-3-methylbut-2-enyl diphosphate reductase [Treponema sp.]
MNIIRAKTIGFCTGVRRAVELAYNEAEHSRGQRPVYTLGPLIHNPQVLDDLKRWGVEILDEHHLPENLHGAVVIIRAHGISPQTETELRRRGAQVVDATCPRVKSSQLKAATFAEAGYRLFLAGEKHHAEIIGIKGYADAAAPGKTADTAAFCAVVSNAAEAEKAAAQLHDEDSTLCDNAATALIGQTTISAEEYQSIGSAITESFPGLEIAQTICTATQERQDSLREMLQKVDAIIIAGGKESANTRRLLAIAEAAGKPCALVETAVDIPADFLKFNTIGLASGASTPDVIIDDIERSLGNVSAVA